MARSAQNELSSIVELVRQHSEGVRRSEIAKLFMGVPQRTLQYRLQRLVKDGRLLQAGKGPAARYRIAVAEPQPVSVEGAPSTSATFPEASNEMSIPLSAEGEEVRAYVKQPQGLRKAVGYFRTFLDKYRPNVSFYLTEADRARLAAIGQTQAEI
jgi:hypothetical protein